MDLYRNSTDADKKLQVLRACVGIYSPVEQEMMAEIAAEVLEELKLEGEASFELFDGIYEVDDDLNVTQIAIPDAAQEEITVEEGVEEENEVPELVEDHVILPPTQEQVTQEEIRHREYVEERRNRNTVRKTESVLRKVHKFFRQEMQEERDILEIPPRRLATLMCSFILGVQKKLPKGVTLESATDEQKFHQPDTLTGYYTGVARYCRDNGYPANIMTDGFFDLFRQVLNTRKTELKDMGLGNKPNEAVPMSPEDVEACWQTGAFGWGSPRILQNTLYFYFSNAFGWRGRSEQTNVRWKDLTIIGEDTDDEHLHWNERLSKTRKGRGPPRVFNPNMWLLEDEDRCPVRMYKLLRSKRSTSQKEPERHFFLTPRLRSSWEMDLPWKDGKNSNMSDGAIGNIMPEVKKLAGLTGAIKGHTVRKTMMTNLLHAGVPATFIAQLSGHKNLNSINTYAVASLEQQKDMYEVVVGSRKRSASTVAPGASLLKKRPSAAAGCAADLHDAADPEPAPAPVPALVRPPVRHPAPLLAPDQAPVARIEGLPGLARHQDIVAGMFSGATFQGPVNVHIHYGNIATSASTNTAVNMSPTIPTNNHAQIE